MADEGVTTSWFSILSRAFERAIEVQVGRLRRKIEADPKNPALIKTVRSGGYVLASAVESR
jgi:two-component system OmpR family response regulator